MCMTHSFIHSEDFDGKTSTRQVLWISSTDFKAKGNVPSSGTIFSGRNNVVSAVIELYTKYYGNTKESTINLTTVDIKSQNKSQKSDKRHLSYLPFPGQHPTSCLWYS